MKTAIIILSLLSITVMAHSSLYFSELQPLWSSWKLYYGKAYSQAEEAARFAIFVENYKKIVDFNTNSNDVKLALNKFGDLTAEEFKTLHSGCYSGDERRARPVASPPVKVEKQIELPASVDWRKKGAVTPVQNQGQCGDCWVFSAVGALEGLYFITHGKLLQFSEDQIVDCDSDGGGCDGGLPDQAFQYTAKYGIETAADYGSDDSGQCKYNASEAIHVNSAESSITPKDVYALKSAIVQQPVSVAIEADQTVFQFYSSGVIKTNCGTSLDHAVLVVGYQNMGTGANEAFIVKNSWGADWGANGYVYISTDGTANNGAGVCGILLDAVVPTP